MPRPPHDIHVPLRPSNSDLLSLLQVNLVLGDGRSLGLTIRGGAEYGLGIYVTGVDPGSEAESSGLKVSGPTPAGWERAPGLYTQGWERRSCAWSSLQLISVRPAAGRSHLPPLRPGRSWEPPWLHASKS